MKISDKGGGGEGSETLSQILRASRAQSTKSPVEESLVIDDRYADGWKSEFAGCDKRTISSDFRNRKLESPFYV